MIDALQRWIAVHGGDVLFMAILCVAYIVIACVNGALKSYAGLKGSRIVQMLSSVLDALAPLVRKDAPGTLKLPGTRSQPPSVPPEIPEAPGREPEEHITPMEGPHRTSRCLAQALVDSGALRRWTSSLQ